MRSRRINQRFPKFAIDTRTFGTDGSGNPITDPTAVKQETPTVSYAEGRTYTGNILQATFVHAYKSDDAVTQGTEGLESIWVVNDATEEGKELTRMPAGYRSFATNVSSEGSYEVYSDASAIADGKGRFFNQCTDDTRSEVEVKEAKDVMERNVKYQVVSGQLKDNFYLFPVKTVVVDKVIDADEDIKSDITTTLNFALWVGGDGENAHYLQGADGIWMESIEVVNGVPQGRAIFSNIDEGEFGVWEIDENGGNPLGKAIDEKIVLKGVTTQHGDTDDNDATIDKNTWTDSVTVINKYEKISVKVTPAAQKLFDGKAPGERAFNFKLVGTSDTTKDVSLSASNDAEGAVTFEKIEYTEPGTYEYVMYEETGDDDGIIYDTASHTMKVVVERNGETGLLDAAVTYDGAEAEPVFANGSAVKAQLGALKTFEKAEPGSRSFEFKLIGTSDNAAGVEKTASNDESGAIDFGTFTYNQLGEYSYQITETAGNNEGITYDSAAHTAKVVVAKAQDNTFAATVTYDDADAQPTFDNSANPVSVQIDAAKTLDGAAPGTRTFNFKLIGASENTSDVALSAANDAEGNISFDPIEYTAEGTYAYKLVEEAGESAAFEYDSTVHDVTVKVTRDADGAFVTQTSYDGNAEQPVFANKTAPVSVTLRAIKTFDNAAPGERSFEFKLAGASENTADVEQTAKNDAEGNVVFDNIEYTAEGTYEYKMTEVTGTDEGIEYDTGEHTVVVTVIKNDEGALVASVAYDGMEAQPVFANKTATTIPDDPTPETPDTPDTPDNPDNPETPDNPDNPETPEAPENPETPASPDQPISDDPTPSTDNGGDTPLNTNDTPATDPGTTITDDPTATTGSEGTTIDDDPTATTGSEGTTIDDDPTATTHGKGTGNGGTTIDDNDTPTSAVDTGEQGMAIGLMTMLCLLFAALGGGLMMAAGTRRKENSSKR